MKGDSCPKDRSAAAGMTARSPRVPRCRRATGTSLVAPPGDRHDGRRGDPPEDDWELPPAGGPGQGLFWCVPAGHADLAGFTGDGGAPAIAPDPLLAGLTAAVAGSDGAGLAGTSDGFVFAVIAAGRRMSSWGTWLELSAMRELALRHPATPDRPARRNQPSTGSPAAGPPASARQPGAGQAGGRLSRRRTGGCR